MQHRDPGGPRDQRSTQKATISPRQNSRSEPDERVGDPTDEGAGVETQLREAELPLVNRHSMESRGDNDQSECGENTSRKVIAAKSPAVLRPEPALQVEGQRQHQCRDGY